MFCNQCEQAANGIGCSVVGVCGKDPDMESLQQLLLYGLKGMAAYKHHARRLGQDDPEVNEFIERALFATMTNVNFDIDSLFALCMECGEKNIRVMQMLNDGHVEVLGKPSPTVVKRGLKKAPGILITGHDLADMLHLLEATKDTGIMVYTHGEMLPGHMYPRLREYPHLAGHYGGAWQKQKREFEEFGGPIVVTTNCVLQPRESYADRIFLTNATGVSGGQYIQDDDFSVVIAKAKEIGDLAEVEDGEIELGYHWTVLLDNAQAVVDAFKSGALRHVYLIGGCDGAELGRNYFSEFAQKTPDDSLILTLGCGKYRIMDHDYGRFGPFPRLLDMGQCNDAYGAVQVALALAEAFECGVNDLPLSLVISWFEQKAVAVLLSLLHLGVKGIRIGPKPPAFITPNIMAVLQEKFDLKLTGEATADLAATLATSA
ncbi:hydroxylamine reductase [bacterium]|nr:hydroxylamine reductase [bacterium]